MATYLRIGAVGASKNDIQIRGEVEETRHAGWIELSSFSFGTGGNSGGDGEKAPDASKRFRDTGLTMSKWIGEESPKILDWSLAGKPYDLQIDACKENGEPYMRLFITEARVTSLGQTSAADEDLTEELKILYKQISIESVGFTKTLGRKTPTTASTTTETETIATRTGPSAKLEAGRGKGVGKNVPKTAAEAATEAAAARIEPGRENPDYVQEDRILTIDKVGGIEFVLGGFVGSEEVSGLFNFRLEVTSDNQAIKGSDVIGKPVSFRIEDHADIDSEQESATREFHGIISKVIQGQQSVDYRDYTLVVVPSAWFLTKRTDCRVFQKKSVVEIIEAVFNEAKFKDFDKSNVRGTYPKLEYCVQYRESDFDFVSRLMEENGIFYFFRFEKNSHKMYLADASVAHANGEDKDVVQSSGSVDGKKITGWTKNLSHISGKASFRDYNHTTPAETLESAATSVVDLPNIKDYELYDYPGRYPNVTDGRQRAQMRIEAEEVAHCVIDGDGNVDSFAAGNKFTVKEHECEDEKGKEYVLTGVVHQARVMPMSDLKARIYYENDFECIPKSVTFRPASETTKPRVHGPQTAVVVGKSGEEIDPDKYASVKVQFHWDRQGKKNEDSSCFVRVAQSIAGKQWGGLWLPRIGQEVVVEFLEGDPDRPIITGAVYNADNMPPYALPANKTQSGVKTRSSKEGKAENFNELRFEDKKGSELVYFHAEKDFERVVQHDDTLTVGENDEGSQTITIEKDRTLTVSKGNETYTIDQGTQTIEVEGDRSITVRSGDETHEVSSGSRETTIETDDTLTVNSGNRSVTVSSGDDAHTVSSGNRTVSVEMGDNSLTVGMGNHTTEVSLGEATTEAMQGIELKVGSNSIKIDQMGIEMKGMMVKIKGEVQTEIKGMMTTVKGDAMLEAGGGITMIG